MFTYEVKVQKTVEDIYGENENKVLEIIKNLGYEAIAFRPIENGESWYATGSLSKAILTHGTPPMGPRLIVRKLPKPRRWIVEERQTSDWNGRAGTLYASKMGADVPVDVVEEIKDC
jgi:hypothetical protein